LINFVNATNDANHYTKPPPKNVHRKKRITLSLLERSASFFCSHSVI